MKRFFQVGAVMLGAAAILGSAFAQQKVSAAKPDAKPVTAPASPAAPAAKPAAKAQSGASDIKDLKVMATGRVALRTTTSSGNASKQARMMVKELKGEDGKDVAGTKPKWVAIIGPKAAEAEKLSGKEVTIKGTLNGDNLNADSVTEKVAESLIPPAGAKPAATAGAAKPADAAPGADGGKTPAAPK